MPVDEDALNSLRIERSGENRAGNSRGRGWLIVGAVAVLLGPVGALIGGAIGYLAFNGVQTSTLNMSSFSQVTFAFRVTGELLRWGLIYALVLALVGGVLPSIRAARLPIASGLREL